MSRSTSAASVGLKLAAQGLGRSPSVSTGGGGRAAFSGSSGGGGGGGCGGVGGTSSASGGGRKNWTRRASSSGERTTSVGVGSTIRVAECSGCDDGSLSSATSQSAVPAVAASAGVAARSWSSQRRIARSIAEPPPWRTTQPRVTRCTTRAAFSFFSVGTSGDGFGWLRHSPNVVARARVPASTSSASLDLDDDPSRDGGSSSCSWRRAAEAGDSIIEERRRKPTPPPPPPSASRSKVTERRTARRRARRSRYRC